MTLLYTDEGAKAQTVPGRVLPPHLQILHLWISQARVRPQLVGSMDMEPTGMAGRGNPLNYSIYTRRTRASADLGTREPSRNQFSCRHQGGLHLSPRHEGRRRSTWMWTGGSESKGHTLNLFICHSPSSWNWPLPGSSLKGRAIIQVQGCDVVWYRNLEPEWTLKTITDKGSILQKRTPNLTNFRMKCCALQQEKPHNEKPEHSTREEPLLHN